MYACILLVDVLIMCVVHKVFVLRRACYLYRIRWITLLKNGEGDSVKIHFPASDICCRTDETTTLTQPQQKHCIWHISGTRLWWVLGWKWFKCSRSAKSEKMYPSMLQRSEELDPYYGIPLCSNTVSHSSQPASPTPSQVSQGTTSRCVFPSHHALCNTLVQLIISLKDLNSISIIV